MQRSRIIHARMTRGAPLDRLMRPVHRWVWGDADRRLRKLLTFADVETDGGRDILRAAEVTPIRCCGASTSSTPSTSCVTAICSASAARRCVARARRRPRVLLDGNPLPGGHGLDDLRIDGEPDHRLLAFLHVAEKSAAGRFAIYRELVDDDPQTRAIFEEILRDEVFHMNYTYTQLTRVSPHAYRRHVWHARAQAAVEPVSARRGGDRRPDRRRGADRAVFRPAAAVRVAREARRAARADWLDPHLARRDTRRRGAST